MVARDWVMDCYELGEVFLLLTAHSAVEYLVSKEGVLHQRQVIAAASGPCILYSGCIVTDPAVLAVTVFGHLLVYDPDTGKLLQTISGHD